MAEILLIDVPRSGGGPAALPAAPCLGAHGGHGGGSLRALAMPGYGERTLDSGARSSKAIKHGTPQMRRGRAWLSRIRAPWAGPVTASQAS